ncbi:cysteine hydrolase family protein [Arthrobacter sulfonylureivorans]|uniref:cysteine hydrolase family protein n=1 Tax=Arthrobacter sulfonylureivorans TaxID=2486855 RepID=UPI0039E2CEF3
MPDRNHTDRAVGQQHLVVIDMQRAFRQQGDWHVPRYDEAVGVIARLVRGGFDPIITRFVPDPTESGSWSAYYDRWQSMRLDPSDPVWDVELPGVETGRTLDLPTFTKWGAELAGRIPAGDEIILTGVATDCCILATALGAVDAGRYVTVVADACAGQSDQAHESTLALLELLSPMVTVTDSAELVSRTQAAAV